MAGSTPIYSLPYPDPSDLVANYPALGQDLAEDLDRILNLKLDSDNVTPGAWVSFTPNFFNGWALGNGTSQAAYARIKKTIIVRLEITFGSTSTYGTNPMLQVPINEWIPFVSGQFYAGGCTFRDVSTAIVYNGTIETNGGNFLVLSALNATQTHTQSNPITSTLPFTWTTGDRLSIMYLYEVN